MKQKTINNERLSAWSAGILLLLLSRCIFVAYEQISFNSDGAVIGLMAKHLAEGGAFPLFMYGQKCMLGVEAFIAAPLFAVFGSSVFLLKLPILFLNIAVYLLLMRTLEAECGLGSWQALVCCMFFTTPATVISCRLTDVMGGNIEPFFWIIVLWILRRKPIAFGAVAAVGFLNREFVAYGIFWIILIQFLSREITWRKISSAAICLVAVYSLIKIMAGFSSNYFGPGVSSLADFSSFNDVFENLVFFFNNLFPFILGLKKTLLQDYGVITRTVHYSFPFQYLMIGLYAGFSLLFLWSMYHNRKRLVLRFQLLRFPLLLLLTGLSSIAAYVVFSGAFHRDILFIRYLLLVLMIPVGMSAAFFVFRKKRANRLPVFAMAILVISITSINTYQVSSLYLEYRDPPPSKYRDLAEYLTDNDIEYAIADYWTAYHTTFLAREKVIITSLGRSRITEYNHLYSENWSKSYTITEEARTGCARVHEWHVCPAKSPNR